MKAISILKANIEKIKENNKKIAELNASNSGRLHQMFILIASIHKWYKRSEMLENFHIILKELDDEKLSEYFAEDTYSFKKEFFVDTVIHCANNIPDFWKSTTTIYMDTFEFVSGDDGSLQYYHKCNICGSYIVVDHGSDEYDKPCICNHCNAHTGYISPHHFIEVNTDEWKAHDRYFKFLYRLENDKWFRYRNAVITKIRSFIPYVMYKAHKLFRKVK